MTLERAAELLTIQIGIAGGYNRNAARVILAEISLKLGQGAVDQLVRELELEKAFGFKEGQTFSY